DDRGGFFDRLTHPPVDLIIRCLQAHLSTSGTDVGPKVNPRGRILDEHRALFQKCLEPVMPELVAARGDEDRGPSSLRGADRAKRFHPAREAATTFGSTLPPATARSHDHERRQICAPTCD